jgi:hypothetical protein
MRIRWRGVETGSTETLELSVAAGGVDATSVVERPGRVIRYAARLTERWEFADLTVEDDLAGTLRLARSSAGEWRVNDELRPDLNAAIDIDLSFSPFTNTLPIRRLALDPGASCDIVTAYVTDALEVLPDPQRYTRLSSERYLYESRDSDFRREILVDAAGLVLDYPGLFVRVEE